MDRETLNEMVKLKFGTRKAGGPEIDLVKLAADAVYADERLRAVESLPDESLVLLALTLREKFGLLPLMQVATASAPMAMETDMKKEAPLQRYMSGARS
jgi:hypothetical protein